MRAGLCRKPKGNGEWEGEWERQAEAEGEGGRQSCLPASWGFRCLLWTLSSLSCVGHLPGSSRTSGMASGHRKGAIACPASQIHPLLPPKKSKAVRLDFCHKGVELEASFNYTAFSMPMTIPGVSSI